MKSLPYMDSINQLENATWLDPAAKSIRKVVKNVIRQRDLRDLLHGVPFGHPLHPVMVQIPIGAWTSASILDLVSGTQKASAVLVGTGIAAVLPAVASGLVDWSKSEPGPQRTGLVHAGVNVVATGLYAISLIQRCSGREKAGKIFSLAGMALVSTGGFIGGHLAYRQGASISRVIDIPNNVPSGWHQVTSLDSLEEGKLTGGTIGETPLVLYRRHGIIRALAATCSHLGGPLDEGKLIDDGDPCVECPWHQSVFSLRTGEVIHGPATAPQPHFETRIVEGQVEARLRPAHS